jgi:long-chain fatty acid transport protein
MHSFMTSSLKAFFAALLWIACPAMGQAAGFRLFDQDAEATARAGAFAATADNPSAVYYNPAGLTQLKGWNASVGTYDVHIDVDYSTLDGKRSTENRDRLLVLPNLYAAYSLPKLPLSFGLGAYSTYGLALYYPDDNPFRSAAKKAQIIYVTVNPVAAWQVTKTFSIGIGPTVNFSQVLLNRGVFAEGDGFRFRGSGVAPGYEIGLRWEPTPQHAFGISYHSSTDVRYSGHTSLTLRPFLAADDPRKVHFPEEDADANLHFPRIILAGYSFRPTPAWNLEFNLDWTDWDSLNSPPLHQQRSAPVPVAFDYQSSFIYHFGATHFFNNGLLASAGYAFCQNSVPEATLDGAVPDNDRHIFTAGFGSRGKRWDWMLAYQLVYQPTRTVSTGTVADGRYQVTANAINISAAYHF